MRIWPISTVPKTECASIAFGRQTSDKKEKALKEAPGLFFVESTVAASTIFLPMKENPN